VPTRSLADDLLDALGGRREPRVAVYLLWVSVLENGRLTTVKRH
jgi:hypothetical protein